MKKKRPHVGPWKTVFKGLRFEIKQAETIFSNGKKATFERSYRDPSVYVLALNQKGQVLLTREYRLGLNKYDWFLVVGKVEDGMAPKKAAMKELQEEIGFKAKKLTFLTKHGAGNSTVHENYFFLAEDLIPAPLDAGEDEDITVHPTSPKKALEMVLNGTISDPLICFGIITLNKYLKAKNKKVTK